MPPVIEAPRALQAVQGLSDAAVAKSLAENGQNILAVKSGSNLFATIKEVVSEPMFLLLLVACGLYLALGEMAEALTLAVALLFVSGISIYQTLRSDHALGALRDLTQPKTKVWRNGKLETIAVEAIVVGDAVMVA